MSQKPKHHRTYGSAATDLDAARDALAQALTLTFRARESDYLGGLYYMARPAAPHAASLKLHLNRDPITGDVIMREVPHFALILQAEDIADPDALTDDLYALGFTPTS